MLRSLFLTGVYFSCLGLGLGAPFIVSLGYVWVDTFRPQDVAYIILNQIPVAMIMGAAAFASYFMMDRRAPPKTQLLTVLQLLMAVWCTMTLLWAVAPNRALLKWDWAFKTVLFSAFVPYVIRSRVQIEAFVQIYLFSLSANFVPYALKVVLSGGGYGRDLGLGRGNTGLGEGGFLSTACLMAAPLAIFLARNSILMPKWKIVPLAYWGVAALAIITAIGTYQRSALIGLIALILVYVLRSQHKLAFMAIGGVIGLILAYYTSDRWAARISTITNYQADNSASVRILVWKWTWGFVQSHPLGGGFNSYAVNAITLPPDAYNPHGSTQFGRAFHSSYFEMLGEHGFPGLALFLGAAAIAFLATFSIGRKVRDIPELQWCASLGIAIQAGLAVFMTAGAFVGLGFQPMFWYFIAMTVCLQAYVHRCLNADASAKSGWRGVAQANLATIAGGRNRAGPIAVGVASRRGAVHAERRTRLYASFAPFHRLPSSFQAFQRLAGQ